MPPGRSHIEAGVDSAMRVRSLRRFSSRVACVVVAAVATLAARSADAQSGTWNVTTSGNWSDSANWLGNVVASGSGSTASFTNDITSDVTVALDAARQLTAVTFGDAATATAGGWTISNGGNAANALTLNGASTITVNTLGTGKIARIDADVTGTNGKVTKSGAGTLTIGGALSIVGNEVNWGGGTVNLVGSSLETGKHITNGSATVNWSVASGTISSNLFGVGDGSRGTFNLLSGRLNYTGNSGFFIGNGGGGPGLMTVQGGTAVLTGASTSLWIGAGYNGTGNSATESGTLTISSGAFEYAGAGTIKLSGSNAGSRGTVNLDGGTFRLNGRQITSGSGVATFSINGGTLQLTTANSAIFATTVSPTIGASGATIDTNGFNGSFGLAPIVGAGTLTKINSGTLTLQPSSPGFTGKTVIAGGAIQTDNDGKLGAAPASFVADQLTLQSGATLRTSAGVTVNANRGITVGSGGGSLALSGAFQYNGRFTGAGNTLATGGSDVVLANSTGVASSVNWNITGSRLFYNGINSLGTGTVTIQADASLVSQGSSPGTVSNAVIVQSGGRISARTSGTYTNVTLPTAGTVVFNRDDSNTTSLVITSGVTLTGTLTVDMSQQAAATVGDATLSGTIAGAHRFVKTGSGTAPGRLILSSTNTYSGGTTITGGALSASTDRNLGAVPGVFTADNIILNGGTLEAGASFTVNANRGITVEAAGGGLTGFITYPGRISGAGNTLSITGNGDKVLSNTTGSPSDVNFNVTGGRLFFTNTNAIGSGAVSVGNAANLVANIAGTPSIGNSVTLANGGRLSARQSGATFTNVTLPTSGTVGFNFDDQPTGALTVAGGATLAGAMEFSMIQQAAGAIGPAVISGAIGGTGNVTKTGVGQLTFAGDNSYIGTTAVSAGTLLVNGTNSGGGGVTVASGATLGGSGSIAGLTSVSGTLSPGNSPGILTLDELSLGSTSTTLIEITGAVRGSAYDGVNVLTAGGLTYGGTLSLSFTSLFADNTSFNLFSFTGAPLGGLAAITTSGSYSSLVFSGSGGVWKSNEVNGQTMTFTESTGNLVIVPEPSALIIAALGLVAAGWAVSRRHQSRP